MTILIQDTARNNLPGWTEAAVNEGIAGGAIISPFASPVVATPSGYKPGAQQTVGRLRALNCQLWFDPMTHVLQMAGAGDWRYYDQWQLWAGLRGRLASDEEILDHVQRVFRVQDSLGLPHLAPTILLHSPQSQTSLNALRIAEIASGQDAGTAQAICGDSQFWASGDDLDAHVGALAQFAPNQWFISVARVASSVPVPATRDEVAGLCRTCRSLGEESSVHISHGDIAALPAVAAGASSIGSGWDVRQRVLAYSDFQERDDSTSGGQWYKRPTLEGLLGSLSSSEYARLESRDLDMATRLLPGRLPPGPQESFMHHARVLNNLITSMGRLSGEQAYRLLDERYQQATLEWPSVVACTGSVLNSRDWIEPFAAGFQSYGLLEGW